VPGSEDGGDLRVAAQLDDRAFVLAHCRHLCSPGDATANRRSRAFSNRSQWAPSRLVRTIGATLSV